jgi:putative amide transporter protein
MNDYSGLVLFYVGAVLILNGLWMRNLIEDREIAVINWLVGGLCGLVALFTAFAPQADHAAIRTAAFSLLFAFTYLWVAYNQRVQANGTGLGWFSLFVAVNALLIAALELMAAQTAWDIWSAVSWAMWSGLWFCFFLMLARGKKIRGFVASLAIAEGVATGWVPGFLLLTRANV